MSDGVAVELVGVGKRYETPGGTVTALDGAILVLAWGGGRRTILRNPPIPSWGRPFGHPR